MRSDPKGYPSKNLNGIFIIILFAGLTLISYWLKTPLWLSVTFIVVGILMFVFLQKSTALDATDEEKAQQTTWGSFGSFKLWWERGWTIIILGAPLYAGLWVGNKYFPKEVRTVTYVPYWDEGKKTSAMCINVEPGVYEFSCSGKITSTNRNGHDYTMSCQYGNPPGWAIPNRDLLSTTPLPDFRQYGRLIISNEQGHIAVLHQRLPIRHTLCINTNVDQTAEGTGDLRGNVHVILYKERFPWLP